MAKDVLQYTDDRDATPYLQIGNAQVLLGDGLEFDISTDEDGGDVVTIKIKEFWLEEKIRVQCDDLYDRINRRGAWSPDY